MFLRAITKHYPSGPVQYLYLLEGFRDQGRVRQRVVATLGRADRLASHLDNLIRLLRPYLAHPVGRLDAVESAHALTYGPVAVARRFEEGGARRLHVVDLAYQPGREQLLQQNRDRRPAQAGAAGDLSPGEGAFLLHPVQDRLAVPPLQALRLGRHVLHRPSRFSSGAALFGGGRPAPLPSPAYDGCIDRM